MDHLYEENKCFSKLIDSLESDCKDAMDKFEKYKHEAEIEKQKSKELEDILEEKFEELKNENINLSQEVKRLKAELDNRTQNEITLKLKDDKTETIIDDDELDNLVMKKPIHRKAETELIEIGRTAHGGGSAEYLG